MLIYNQTQKTKQHDEFKILGSHRTKEIDMGNGTAFGKTIFIGDQFVLREVPAILAALPFVTEAVVERIDGEG